MSPTYYDDPTPVLVRSDYAVLDAGALLAGTAALLLASLVLFGRRDI